MKILQQVSMLAAGCALCLTTAMAQAAVTTTAIHASALPSGKAKPALNFEFDDVYDDVYEFTTLTLWVDYDPTLMTLKVAESTWSMGGPEYGLYEFLDGLALSSDSDFSYIDNDDPGSYSLSAGFITGNLPIPAGSMTIKGVFDLKPGFLADMSTDVVIYGTLTSTAADVDPFLGDDFDVTATVTAVPEPETWLMLLSGLGLVVAQRMRRSAMERN